MEATKRRSAIYRTNHNPNCSFSPDVYVPVWVYEINLNDFFQVKFEYKQRGYKGLRFSDQSYKFELQ